MGPWYYLVKSLQAYGPNFSGTADNDRFVGGMGANVMDGGVGNDELLGGNDNDVLRGGDNDDLLKEIEILMFSDGVTIDFTVDAVFSDSI